MTKKKLLFFLGIIGVLLGLGLFLVPEEKKIYFFSPPGLPTYAQFTGDDIWEKFPLPNWVFSPGFLPLDLEFCIIGPIEKRCEKISDDFFIFAPRSHGKYTLQIEGKYFFRIRLAVFEVKKYRLYDSTFFIPDFGYDLDSDSSSQKYVDSSIAITEKLAYVPVLREVRGKKVSALMQKNLESMLAAAKKDNIGMWISSGYRSYRAQSFLYSSAQRQLGENQYFVAPPGHSEHQLGLAVDFSPVEQYFSQSKKYKWLTENAHKYGFINSYHKENSMSGYTKEPWHWRYVGVHLATYLHENNLEFSEYYYGEVVN